MKKFLPYIFILILLVGIFSPVLGFVKKAQADDGWCEGPNGEKRDDYHTKASCEAKPTDNPAGPGGTWHETSAGDPSSGTADPAKDNVSSQTGQKGTFQSEVAKYYCGLGAGVNVEGSIGAASLTGCLVLFTYIFYYQVPTFILWLVAHIFNVMVYVSLSGDLIRTSAFVETAWTIVRDLSNIFFILILLYIAIKIILDLGAGEAKKMIAKVIIVAMLINFSMFFTKVIIDSSNILALIFYNKMDTNTSSGGVPRPYASLKGEKDMAGAMVEGFDPTKAIDEETIRELKAIYAEEVKMTPKDADPMPAGLIIMFMLMAGSMMYYVAVVLAVAALAFIIRIIELWVLIIFSPFALLSSTVPQFADIEYLGWNQWFKRLIKTAFMAPLFMFFLYFIFLLIKTDIFKGFIPASNATNPSTAGFIIMTLLNMMLPLIFIEILLYKALRFAITSSGKIGEMAEKAVVGGAKMAAVAGLAVVTEGASLAATSAIGSAGAAIKGNEGLRMAANKGGFMGGMAKMALRGGDYASKADINIGKTLSKVTGVDISTPLGKTRMFNTEGGFEGRVKRQTEVIKKDSELMKTTKTDAEVKAESEEKKAEWEEGKKHWDEKYEGINGPRPESTKEEIQKQRKYDREKEALYKKQSARAGTMTPEAEKEFKLNFNKIWEQEHGPRPETKTEVYDKKKKAAADKYEQTKPPYYETAEQLDRGNRQAYAERLGKGSKFSYSGMAPIVGAVSSGRAAEIRFAKEVGKEMKQSGRIGERLESSKEGLEEMHKFMESMQKMGLEDAEGKPITELVSVNTEGKFTVDTGKLEAGMASLKTAITTSDAQVKHLAVLSRENTAEGLAAQKELITAQKKLSENIEKEAKLNRLRTAPEKIETLKTQIYNLGKDKAAAGEKGKAEEKAPPSNPPPSSH